jgi:hypothetical protein
MCAMLVRHKIDADAGDVIAAMLQLSRPHETRLQEDRSAPLAEAAITAVVAKAATKGACRIQPEQVPGTRGGAALVSLALHARGLRCRALPMRPQRCCAAWRQTRLRCVRSFVRVQCTHRVAYAGCVCVQLVTCVGEAHGGASYCVNMKRIIDLIRMKEVRAQPRGCYHLGGILWALTPRCLS